MLVPHPCTAVPDRRPGQAERSVLQPQLDQCPNPSHRTSLLQPRPTTRAITGQNRHVQRTGCAHQQDRNARPDTPAADCAAAAAAAAGLQWADANLCDPGFVGLRDAEQQSSLGAGLDRVLGSEPGSGRVCDHHRYREEYPELRRQPAIATAAGQRVSEGQRAARQEISLGSFFLTTARRRPTCRG